MRKRLPSTRPLPLVASAGRTWSVTQLTVPLFWLFLPAPVGRISSLHTRSLADQSTAVPPGLGSGLTLSASNGQNLVGSSGLSQSRQHGTHNHLALDYPDRPSDCLSISFPTINELKDHRRHITGGDIVAPALIGAIQAVGLTH
jgi:hypothetical protein